MKSLYPILKKLLFFLLIMHLTLIMLGPNPILKGALIDTDSYMHLNRVTELYITGDWYNSLYPRSNPPFGEELHWTRCFDLILLLGTGLLLPFAQFSTALHVWGVSVSPVLQVLALVGLLWGTRPFFSQTQLLVIGGLFLIQLPIFVYCQAGRPDHHSFLLALFMWFMACTMRLVSQPFKRSVCLAAGILGALSIWTSIEGFIWLFIGLAALTVSWGIYGEDFGKKGFYVAQGLLFAGTVFLLIERPPEELRVIEYDRFSFVHWTAITLIWGFWLLIYGLSRQVQTPLNRTRRWIVIVIGIMAMVGMQGLWHPNFFYGPLTGQDPQMLALLWNNIVETQPLVSWNPFRISGLFLYLGIVLPTGPYLVWLLARESSRTRTRLWIFIGAALLILIPLAVMQVRSSIFSAALLVIPYSDLLLRLAARFDHLPNVVQRHILQMSLVLVGCLGLSALGVGLKLYEQPHPEASSEPCPIRPLSMHLNDPATIGKNEKTILAFVNFGPELLYRTNHKVVSTPYHRNIRAIIDTNDIMRAATFSEAHDRLEKRQVDLLVLCPESGEQRFYNGNSGKAVFYERLIEGNLPDWLRAIPLPENLSKQFQVFELIPVSH